MYLCVVLLAYIAQRSDVELMWRVFCISDVFPCCQLVVWRLVAEELGNRVTQVCMVEWLLPTSLVDSVAVSQPALLYCKTTPKTEFDGNFYS